jgi:acyl carrier protein
MPASHGFDRATILAEVTDIARLVFGDPLLEPTLETTSDDVPCWDSMNHIALVVEAECRFGIECRTSEIEDLKSISELVRAIETKLTRVHA